MTNQQSLDAVRDYLRHWYATQHRSLDWEPVESLLVNDGFYCGRKFLFGPYKAVWFVEENQVKIFNPDGTVSAKQDVAELLSEKQTPETETWVEQPQRKAA